MAQSANSGRLVARFGTSGAPLESELERAGLVTVTVANQQHVSNRYRPIVRADNTVPPEMVQGGQISPPQVFQGGQIRSSREDRHVRQLL